MKILFVGEFFNFNEGGPSVSLACLSKKLVELNHKVAIVTYPLSAKTPYRIPNDPRILISRAKPILAPSSLSYLGKLVSESLVSLTLKTAIKFKPDILVTGYSAPSDILAALTVNKTCGIPFILNFRGTDAILAKNIDLKELAFEGCRQAKYIIVSGNILKEDIVGLGVKKSKISLVKPLIDIRGLEKIEPAKVAECRKKWLGNSEILIGQVGMVESHKGIWISLEAFNKISRKINASLVFIGSGSEIEKLKTQIKSMKLKKRCSLPGSIFPIQNAMKAFDILLMPSITTKNFKESFGRVIAEAMVLNIPVIGSSSGEIPDTINDGKTGFVVPEKNPDALANQILKTVNLIGTPKMKKISTRARQWVINTCSLEKTLPKLIKLYEDAQN